MNNDELQKAIDDITRDNAAPVENNGAVDNEALANEIVGVPVRSEGAGLPPIAQELANEMPAAPAPAVPEMPGMPPAPTNVSVNKVNAAPEPVAVEATPVPPAPAPASTPQETPAPEVAPVAAEPEPVSVAPETGISSEPSAPSALEESEEKTDEPKGDLAEVEKEALKELYPLLGKVQMEPEEKFNICMKVAEEDKSAVSGALEAAKQISDETTRAEALLEIIEAIK